MGFSLGKLFGGGGGGGTAPVLDKNAFDLGAANKKYGARTDEQYQNALQNQQFTTNANQALITQLQGAQPSIAQAQLKAAQDRSLAQSMALAASQRGGNPALAQRQLLQQQGAAGRDLSQQGAIMGLQEQQANRQLLANQLLGTQAQANQAAQYGIGQGFGQEEATKKLMSEFEKQRFAADVARQNQIKGQQGGILGRLIAPAATLAGGFFGGPAGAAIGSAIGGAISGQGSGGGSLTSLFSGGTGAPAEASVEAPTYSDKAFADNSATGGQYTDMSGVVGSNNSASGGRATPTFSSGGMVSGKPIVKGDSESNDTVPAMLSPGEIVVPRTAVQKGPTHVKMFIDQLMEGHGPKQAAHDTESIHKGFEAILKSHAALAKKLEKLGG